MAQDAAETPLTADDRAELHLLYSVSVSDIVLFKQQQWVVTSHALAVQAGLVAVGRLLYSPLCAWERWLLIILVGITVSAGMNVVLRLRRSIEARRKRLRRVRGEFGKPFNDAWQVCKEPDHVHIFLVVAQVIAALVASWLVLAAL